MLRFQICAGPGSLCDRYNVDASERVESAIYNHKQFHETVYAPEMIGI